MIRGGSREGEGGGVGRGMGEERATVGGDVRLLHGN